MGSEQEGKNGRVAYWGACIRYVAPGILTASLANPTGAWGASVQHQLATAEQPSMILAGLKMMGALALILGLLLLSLHLLKRWRPGILRRYPDSQVQILDVRMLAHKSSIALVEVAGERLLLGVGTDRVTLLSKIGSHPHQDRAEPKEGGAGFSNTLLHMLQGQQQQDDPETVEHTDAVTRRRGDAEITEEIGAETWISDDTETQEKRDAETRRHGDTEIRVVSKG